MERGERGKERERHTISAINDKSKRIRQKELQQPPEKKQQAATEPMRAVIRKPVGIGASPAH